jgi:hypothetical protein
MKKRILFLFCAAVLVVSACSKNDQKEKEQTSAQTTEAKKDNPSSDASSKESDEKSTETAANTSDDDSAKTESDQASEANDDTKDYLTENHEFVASEIANMTEKQVSDKWGQPEKTEESNFRFSGTSNFVPAVIHS